MDLRESRVQGNQTRTIFSWRWRNKPAPQNNRQSSDASEVHVPQYLPSDLCRHFSLEEMKSATKNFDESRLAGEGKYAKVYYGVIDGVATKVAIKRAGRFGQDVDMFQKEIAKTAKLNHHHLVSLVGYCIENNEMIQIDEYMAGGSLAGRLYAYNTREPPLTWRQRLDVCIGAARALHYLHECSIIHFDLTTSCILLDERFVAKVSGALSLSALYDPKDEPTMVVKGFGRGDLDFIMTGLRTEKSNVYSFGVMLFEVLCARAASDRTLPIKQVFLIACALNCKKKGILDLIVDPYLEGKIAPRCFDKFVEIAVKCVAEHGVDRPSMREVLQDLEMCLAEQSEALVTIDETTGDDGTNRPSMEERRRNLEKYLSDESGRYGSELWTPDDDASTSSMDCRSTTAP